MKTNKIDIYDAQRNYVAALRELSTFANNLSYEIKTNLIPLKNSYLQDCVAEVNTNFDIYYNAWKEYVKSFVIT